MIVYLDSSVILRRLLGQPGELEEWDRIERGVASELVEVECLRTVDRLRIASSLSAEKVVALRQAVFRTVKSLEIVELSRPVLARAAQPLPTPLGTLDALHLASALLWSEHLGLELTMATHDEGLARASEAFGLQVIGS